MLCFQLETYWPRARLLLAGGGDTNSTDAKFSGFGEGVVTANGGENEAIVGDKEGRPDAFSHGGIVQVVCDKGGS